MSAVAEVVKTVLSLVLTYHFSRHLAVMRRSHPSWCLAGRRRVLEVWKCAVRGSHPNWYLVFAASGIAPLKQHLISEKCFPVSLVRIARVAVPSL